jgi:hypothetical protein
MDDVNIDIDELVLEHPTVASDQRIPDFLEPLRAGRLGAPVIAEIRRAVSAALGAGSETHAQPPPSA